MSDQQQADIQRQLNDLNRLVGGLSASIDAFNETWQRQDAAASQGRQRLYERFEKFERYVRDALSGLGARVTNVENTLKGHQTSVDAFNADKLRSEGAQRFGLWLWSGLLIAAGFVGYVVHELLEWYFHLPPLPPKH